jgi:hypothetical protein
MVQPNNKLQLRDGKADQFLGDLLIHYLLLDTPSPYSLYSLGNAAGRIVHVTPIVMRNVQQERA